MRLNCRPTVSINRIIYSHTAYKLIPPTEVNLLNSVYYIFYTPHEDYIIMYVHHHSIIIYVKNVKHDKLHILCLCIYLGIPF